MLISSPNVVINSTSFWMSSAGNNNDPHIMTHTDQWTDGVSCQTLRLQINCSWSWGWTRIQTHVCIIVILVDWSGFTLTILVFHSHLRNRSWLIDLHQPLCHCTHIKGVKTAGQCQDSCSSSVSTFTYILTSSGSCYCLDICKNCCFPISFQMPPDRTSVPDHLTLHTCFPFPNVRPAASTSTPVSNFPHRLLCVYTRPVSLVVPLLVAFQLSSLFLVFLLLDFSPACFHHCPI